MSDDEPVKTTGEAAAPAKAPDATPAKPRVRRKKAAPPPKPQTARDALVSLGEQIRAARRQARSTERVGWGLFRDDVRRGRIIDLAGLALLVALTVTFVTSPDYQVQSVTVVNSRALTNEQAARLTGVLGTNIFLVDSAKVAARLRQSPFIKDASVETTLPD